MKASLVGRVLPEHAPHVEDRRFQAGSCVLHQHCLVRGHAEAHLNPDVPTKEKLFENMFTYVDHPNDQLSTFLQETWLLAKATQSTVTGSAASVHMDDRDAMP